MRVSIIGQAAFGDAVLKRLREDGVEVCAASAPQPREGGRPDALWAAAQEQGIPTFDTKSLKTDEGLQAWKETGAELCVMAFVTEILPDEVFGIPTHGTIQYHPSLLPLHRGSSAINWAVIYGRNETGLTIFWPDRGIDTGPILLQRSVPIGPDDTVGSLYFNSLFPEGVDAMSEAVALVAQRQAPRIDQDHSIATYEPPCGEEHGQIRWHEPADRLYALIRGCNPQPGAWSMVNDAKLRIFDCRLTGTQEPGMPGRVLRVTDEGFDVRLNGGVLRVSRVQPDGSGKVPATEWAKAVGLREGFRFR
jgi:methionyl-tRNA formyltransferase